MIHKARRTIIDTPVPDLALSATETIPEMETLAAARVAYRLQGREVVDALWVSLPGGTLDAILLELLELLERKASLLRIPHATPTLTPIPTLDQLNADPRGAVEADPSTFIERMLKKLDPLDREAFNFCMRQARAAQRDATG